MRKHSALITLVYIVLAAIWLILGNTWIAELDRQTPKQDLRFLYSYKNIIFLLVSGVILFLLIEMYRRRLSRMETNYQHLFEGTIAAIYVFDKNDYRFLEVNGIMVRKYGYSRKELLNMTIMDIRDQGEQAGLDNYLRGEHAEGRATGIWKHRKKNGDIFHMLISHHSTVFNGKPAYMVIAVDIEKHVKVEAQIKELLKVYETVTSVTNDVIWEYCPHTDQTHWMHGFSEIFGYTEDLREPTKDWVMGKIHPEDRKRVERTMDESLAKLSNSWRCEYRMLCANGQYKYVSNQAFILLDKDGHAEKMLGALRDITLRKEYEKRLLEKNEMLNEIAWNNSHQLRRPLSNILGMVNLWKMDGDDLKIDQASLAMLERSALELDEIINKINDSAGSVDLKN